MNELWFAVQFGLFFATAAWLHIHGQLVGLESAFSLAARTLRLSLPVGLASLLYGEHLVLVLTVLVCVLVILTICVLWRWRHIGGP